MRSHAVAVSRVFVVSAFVFIVACRRPAPDVNPIVPSMKLNRDQVAIGGAVEVTYSWVVEPGARPIPANYRAFAHFLDPQKTVLFDDDHVPQPSPDKWEAGKTYTYTRTLFVPSVAYVGPVQLIMGLYPDSGKGDRIALKAEDIGMRAHRVGTAELTPQTGNIFLVYKDGWYGSEAEPKDPVQRTWTKQSAVVSFKNPKQDVVVYLQADTNVKAFVQPPVLTVSAGAAAAISVPIESSDVFLKRIRFDAKQLGEAEWVDLRLAMSESFVPKKLGMNQDSRELGLMVYHLCVMEASKIGSLPAGQIVNAQAAPPVPAQPQPVPRPTKSLTRLPGRKG
jgi:hypothetical protein